MKKILSICCLALFLGAFTVGCSSSTTSGTAGSGSQPAPADNKPKTDVKGKAE